MDTKAERTAKELIEREKELDALYTLSRILTDPEIREEELIERSADIIRTALQAPFSAEVLIETPLFTFTSGSVDSGQSDHRVVQDYGENYRLTLTCRCSSLLLDREIRLIDSASLLIANSLRSRLIRKDLENKHIALREVLHQVEQSRAASTGSSSSNLISEIIPFVRQLLASGSLQARDKMLGDYILRTLLSADVTNQALPGIEHLTPREKQISSLVRLGLSTKEIAHMFCLSDQTVERHRNTIRRKLGINGTRKSLTTYLRGRTM
jgi:DNA-binding CsgD family transcriptional regulator